MILFFFFVLKFIVCVFFFVIKLFFKQTIYFDHSLSPSNSVFLILPFLGITSKQRDITGSERTPEPRCLPVTGFPTNAKSSWGNDR